MRTSAIPNGSRARQGLPLALYGDRFGALVRNDRHWSLEEELAGAQFPTHLGRMLQELGVGYIAAQSPQAKGRIERLWATLQDRLVSELRVRGLTTVDAAHAYLPTFIADFNQRFGIRIFIAKDLLMNNSPLARLRVVPKADAAHVVVRDPD